MKLYDSALAPNPRRVRIYLAEKGLKVPSVQVDIGKAENRAAEYLKKNPMGGVPILELDDGSFLAETIAICRYFEEQNPNPPLFGTDARDKAMVEMWQRRMELNLFNMATGAFRNTHAFFKGRIPQVPEYGQVCKDAANKAARVARRRARRAQVHRGRPLHRRGHHRAERRSTSAGSATSASSRARRT